LDGKVQWKQSFHWGSPHTLPSGAVASLSQSGVSLHACVRFGALESMRSPSGRIRPCSPYLTSSACENWSTHGISRNASGRSPLASAIWRASAADAASHVVVSNCRSTSNSSSISFVKVDPLRSRSGPCWLKIVMTLSSSPDPPPSDEQAAAPTSRAADAATASGRVMVRFMR
jgi:hypothetical protein